MTGSTRNNNSPATNRDYRESSVISIDSSDGENQDTNQDAPHELDEEYTVPQGHDLAPVAEYVNKGKQRAQNEAAEDGDDEDGGDYRDEDDVMLDGGYIIEVDQNENGAASQEEINEWARVQLEKLDVDIEAANKKIRDLNEKKKKAEDRAADSRTRHRLGFLGKKMGAHQLDKIRKAQTDAEASIKKTNDELARVQEKLTRLEEQRDDVEYDTVRKFTEAREKHRPRKPRKLGNRCFGPEHNLASEDDSLAEPLHEQDRKAREKARKAREAREGQKTTKTKKTREADEEDDENKKARACNRCKLAKQSCNYTPGSASCDRCAVSGERCRYQDYFTGQQVRPNYLQDKLAQLAAVKAELANLREKSAVSAGAENPLSGITGYGPPTQKLARQNWALMVRGHAPRPPLPTSTPGGHSSSVLVKRKSPTESNNAEPSQPAKRQRQAESNPPKQYAFQNETAETLAGSSKRGRKQVQTSTSRTTRQIRPQTVPTPEDQNQQNDPSAYPFTFRYPPEDSTNPTQPPTVDQPQSNAVSVSNTKLWWAQTISNRGEQLPTNILYAPEWPRWANQMNEKQELWFDTLYSAGAQIPLVEGKIIEDDGGVEPLWPSWTRVVEELNQNQKEHLVRAVQGQFGIRELHDEDGAAQGTVDWRFADSRVQSQGQSPAQ